MIICIVVFAFVQPPRMQHRPAGTVNERYESFLEAKRFTDRWALVPCEVTHLRSMHDGAPCDGYPVDRPDLYPTKSPLLALLTSMFLHVSLLHLAGNMLLLWVFARLVEDRFGPWATLLLFVLGGLVASLGYVALHPESVQRVIGASGAISAIMGAYLVLRPMQRVLSVVYLPGLQVVYIPAWAVLTLFFVAQFVTPGRDGVAWEAHVIGMIFGILTGFVVRRLTPDRRELHPERSCQRSSSSP